MSNIKNILKKAKNDTAKIRFTDLCKLCEYFFGSPRKSGGSHRIYKTPWLGNPRINIQDKKGMGKIYQFKQVLAAIDKLEKKSDKK